jgi:hypothetical protein
MPRATDCTAETELYGPVRDYLTEQGYTVRAEVEGCDVTAVKDEELVIIELKRTFNIRLLVQAAQRQRITDSVYVALPDPPGGIWTKRWRQIQHLLRRLELGLILVSFRRGRALVEIAFHPLPYVRQKKRASRRAVLREMEGRSGNFNTGGSVRRKLVTAYRESAIHVACALEECGPLSPRQLRSLGTGPKTQSILYNNHYGWFERISKGIYRLRPRGGRALARYAKLAEYYRGEIGKSQPV